MLVSGHTHPPSHPLPLKPPFKRSFSPLNQDPKKAGKYQENLEQVIPLGICLMHKEGRQATGITQKESEAQPCSLPITRGTFQPKKTSDLGPPSRDCQKPMKEPQVLRWRHAENADAHENMTTCRRTGATKGESE